MKSVVFLPFILFSITAFSQTQIEADCGNAVLINLTRDYRVVETHEIPTGPGQEMEIQAPSKDPYFFKKEHHTAWYKFKAPFTGVMAMEVMPFDVKNDYDFLLFQDTTGNFCDDLKNKKIKPLRSVISRNDLAIDSKTGLSAYYEQNNIQAGPGDSYGRSINVKKGQRYYLVLDNVYGGGDGHRIRFSYYYRPKIRGTVTDASNEKPLSAQIWLQEVESEKYVDSTFSDSTSGRYRLNRPLEYGLKYQLTYKAFEYFDLTKAFNPSKKNSPINAALFPKRAGANIILKDLLFVGNQAKFLPRSIPELKKLLTYMQTYDSLVIEVEGHVNAAGFGKGYQTPESLSIPRYQDLSEDRATAVKTYLVKNGIDSSRVTTIGYGATKMLFPVTMYDEEMEKNRRVEIKIVSF